jgi:MFS family permease
MFLQIGGALAPVLVVPIQDAYGWRASFWIFGLAGIAWSAAWYVWFRDSPAEVKGASPEELALVGDAPGAHHSLPWSVMVRSGNLWAVVAMAGCVGYSMSFFQSWLGTYLVKARGYTETGLLLASLPFIVGAVAKIAGGFIGDAMVRRLGLRRGRRVMILSGYGGAAAFLALATQLHGQSAHLAALSLAYGGITFGQPALMGICLDIGGRFAGAVTGAMNSSAYGCAFLSSVVYGYLVSHFGYAVPFIPMIFFMAVATVFGLRVDAERQVVPESLPHAVSIV